MRLDQHLEGGRKMEEGELVPSGTHSFMKRGTKCSILTYCVLEPFTLSETCYGDSEK